MWGMEGMGAWGGRVMRRRVLSPPRELGCIENGEEKMEGRGSNVSG